MDGKPFRVGPLLVKRIPSSSVRFRVHHEGYWHGFLYTPYLCINLLDKVGKLIEVRTVKELNAECLAYKAQLVPGLNTRLAYYEVIDADCTSPGELVEASVQLGEEHPA